MRRVITLCFALSVFATWSSFARSANLDISVCRDIKGFLYTYTEGEVFNMFRNDAMKRGVPKTLKDFKEKIDIVPEVYLTKRDKQILRGYKLSRRTGTVIGAILFVQGNGMLAEQVIPHLTKLLDDGYDIFVYNYRGYGIEAKSEGEPYLKAIVDDYLELSSQEILKKYNLKLLYGVSFGAIVAANVLGARAPFNKAVLDSPLSTLESYNCPEQYWPVNVVPKDAKEM